MPLLAPNRKDTRNGTIVGRLAVKGPSPADWACPTGKHFYCGGIVTGTRAFPKRPAHAIVVSWSVCHMAS
jgi:hypothetical protein